MAVRQLVGLLRDLINCQHFTLPLLAKRLYGRAWAASVRRQFLLITSAASLIAGDQRCRRSELCPLPVTSDLPASTGVRLLLQTPLSPSPLPPPHLHPFPPQRRCAFVVVTPSPPTHSRTRSSHTVFFFFLSLRSSQSLYSRAEQHSDTIYKILKTNKNCIQNRISR